MATFSVDGQRGVAAVAQGAGRPVLRLELVPTEESRAFVPMPMALDIVFEDEHLLVLDKPAGLVVHPAPGNWSGTLLNGLLARHARRDACRVPASCTAWTRTLPG